MVEVKSPEYKARVAENLAKKEKRRKERKAKREEENRYETPWIDVEILDYHEGWKKSYLMYAATYRDGTVKTHKSDIRFFIGEYNLNKTEGGVPVRYFTELLCEALGITEEGKAL